MTVITRKLGPTYFLGTIIICWGAIMIVCSTLRSNLLPLTYLKGMGFAKDWEQLVATRCLLGILEAAFFPACVYLLSSWYSRCKDDTLYA